MTIRQTNCVVPSIGIDRKPFTRFSVFFILRSFAFRPFNVILIRIDRKCRIVCRAYTHCSDCDRTKKILWSLEREQWTHFHINVSNKNGYFMGCLNVSMAQNTRSQRFSHRHGRTHISIETEEFFNFRFLFLLSFLSFVPCDVIKHLVTLNVLRLAFVKGKETLLNYFSSLTCTLNGGDGDRQPKNTK